MQCKWIFFYRTHVHITRTHTEARASAADTPSATAVSFSSGPVCSYTIRVTELSLTGFIPDIPSVTESYKSHGVFFRQDAQREHFPNPMCLCLKANWAPPSRHTTLTPTGTTHPHCFKVEASLASVNEEHSLEECAQTDLGKAAKIILLRCNLLWITHT